MLLSFGWTGYNVSSNSFQAVWSDCRGWGTPEAGLAQRPLPLVSPVAVLRLRGWRMACVYSLGLETPETWLEPLRYHIPLEVSQGHTGRLPPRAMAAVFQEQVVLSGQMLRRWEGVWLVGGEAAVGRRCHVC